MQKSGKSSIQDGKCFELELRIQRFTKCKYFSARWFNILIFRKMMAEEFEYGCNRRCVTSQGDHRKDGRGKVNDWEAGTKQQ